MSEQATRPLAGKRILVVEDDFLIAVDVTHTLGEAGADVVGPVGTVADALALVESGRPLDAALLDVNLRGERVYRVADALTARSVKFVFTTGYDAASIAPAYNAVPRCEKPIDRAKVIELLSR